MPVSKFHFTDTSCDFAPYALKASNPRLFHTLFPGGSQSRCSLETAGSPVSTPGRISGVRCRVAVSPPQLPGCSRYRRSAELASLPRGASDQGSSGRPGKRSRHCWEGAVPRSPAGCCVTGAGARWGHDPVGGWRHRHWQSRLARRAML